MIDFEIENSFQQLSILSNSWQVPPLMTCDVLPTIYHTRFVMTFSKYILLVWAFSLFKRCAKPRIRTRNNVFQIVNDRYSKPHHGCSTFTLGWDAVFTHAPGIFVTFSGRNIREQSNAISEAFCSARVNGLLQYDSERNRAGNNNQTYFGHDEKKGLLVQLHIMLYEKTAAAAAAHHQPLTTDRWPSSA